MDLNEYRKWFNDKNAYLQELGGELTVLEDLYAEVSLHTDSRHGNVNGTVHGGVLMAIADTAVGAASKSRGSHSATLEGKLNFIRPVLMGSDIRAEARAVHAGRKTGVYECRILDENNRLMAVGTYTMFMLDKPLSERA